MSVAALISDMVLRGVDADIIGRVAEALTERAPAVDAQAERRRERDRARKAERARGNLRNSAESAEAKKAPTPQKKTTPIPPLTGGTFPNSAPSPEKPEATALVDWVTEIWDNTPVEAHRRSSRRDTETALRAAIRRGQAPERIVLGLAGYYETDDATKQDRKFAKGVHVMIENDRWEAFLPSGPKRSAETDDPWPRRLLRWRTGSYWNSEWGPKPDKPGYLGPAPESQERAA